MRSRGLFPLMAILVLLAAPVMAGEKSLYGSPHLTAAISGTNEFIPGQDVTLTVKIQNTGTTEVTIVQSSIITSEDKPTTAKLLVVGLSPGSAPVTVKTDPQMVGDLAGGSSTTASFSVKIAASALGGVYSLPLRLEYQYLDNAEEVSTDTVRYWYRSENITLPLSITVKPIMLLDQVVARTEHLNAGTEGYLTLSVKNVGAEYGRNAVARLGRYGASPLIPTDASVFIGDFPPGTTAEVRFKVSVSGNAEAQEYPVNLHVEYDNSEGDAATSNTVVVGVPVGGKIEFQVTSPASRVNPGQKVVLEVTYRNSGAITAYRAEARISAVDPFTSNDDTAYLGDLAPGEAGVARYEITVDSGATPKIYGLNSEIRYRDALDNSQISDTVKVEIEVVPAGGILGLLGNPILLSVIIALALGALYYILVHRKRT